MADAAELLRADDLLAWLRPAWHADALCKEYPDVDFFPERGDDTMRARAICARCLVQAECLAAGLDGHEVGIWGGTSGKARRTGKLDNPISTGPPSRYSRDERLRIALDMRADGRRTVDIAKALDCSPSAAANLLWRHDAAEQRRAS